jgi:putative heme-binding domain-containing protein
LLREEDVVRLCEYADWLARVHKKPGPWDYWDYRPKPRPPNQVSWERTKVIADTLKRIVSLSNIDPEVRLAVLKRMQREKVPANLEVLAKWLKEDSDPKRVTALLDFLRNEPAADLHQSVEAVIRSPSQTSANRLAALALFIQGIDEEHADELLALSEGLEDGPVLAETIRLMRKYPNLPVAPLLSRKLRSQKPEVRAAAIETLGELRAADGRKPLVGLLADEDPQVRRAAAGAAGKLEERRALKPLLKLAADNDLLVRAASLEAIRLLKEPRGVPLAIAALGDRETEQIALHLLRDLGDPEQAGAVADLAKRNPARDVLTAAVQVLNTWRERPGAIPSQRQELDRAVAEIHGSSGNLVRWNVSGPAETSDDVVFTHEESSDSRIQFAAGTEGRVVVSAKGPQIGSRFQARTDIAVSDETGVEFLASSSGTLQLWLNGTLIYHRKNPQSFHIDSDRLSGTLAKGNNRLAVLIEAGSPESPVEFHLRFRRKSAIAQHERLAAAVLARPGNLERGRQLFLNKEKSLCLKCHRMGDQGERVGPDLTGLGNRFSRVYITESVLDPSRTIAPTYGTLVVALKGGQVFSGIKVAESETLLTLADNQGQRQLVAKADIEEQQASALSTMPEGLEKRMTDDEFVDLIAFLASLQEGRTL